MLRRPLEVSGWPQDAAVPIPGPVEPWKLVDWDASKANFGQLELLAMATMDFSW